MSLLLDIFGYLSVLLRGFVITAQSLTLGGIVFLTFLAAPLAAELGPAGVGIVLRARRMLAWSAALLAGVTVATLAVETSVLKEAAQLDWTTALGADFVHAEAAAIASAAVIAWVGRPRYGGGRPPLAALLALGLILLVSSTATSHANAQLDGRLALGLADMAHEAAAAAWIGGIPYFLMALGKCHDGAAWRRVGKRFSVISMVSVGLLFAAGLAMAVVYIGSVEAVYGTAYGVMVSTKVVLFACLLLLGFMNFRVVERLRDDPRTTILRLRRFAEVELGVGLTVFFAAASLTSLPPARDLIVDRVTIPEIVERLTPEWPRFSSPDHESLALQRLQEQLDREAMARSQSKAPEAYVPGAGVPVPRNAADIAWSEYNHHWSGVLVLAIGVLALAERTGHARWARNWPLLFLALAVFLFLRSDPEVWPLGSVGFWQSFRDPEVVQHRIFIAVIVGFGIFEWAVRTGRLQSAKAAYVFPLITAVGGALLLTHSHALSNIKDQLLIELTHVPLALLGILAAWARWIELRLGGRAGRWGSWTWPVSFVLVGLILLSYREA